MTRQEKTFGNHILCKMERGKFNWNRETSKPDECLGPPVYYTCESCKMDGQRLTAAGYCVNCDEYMCDECYRCHRRPKILKNHVLLGRSEMPKERKPIDTNDICFDLCTSHEKKVIEYFCEGCDVIGCNACMTIEHRSCVNVQFIPKLVKTSGFERNYRLFQKDPTENAIKSCETEKEQIKRYQQAVAINSAELKRQLKAVIDEFYREGITRIDQHEQMNINELNSKLTQLDKILDDLKGIKSDFDDKKQTKKLCPLFCALNNANAAVKHYKMLIETIQNEMSVTKITFKSSSLIQNEIQGSKIFDKVSKQENRKKSQKHSIEKAEYKRSINVGEKNSYLDISGCCFLSGGFLALVLRRNNKIKVIKLDESNVQHIETSAEIKTEESGLNSQNMTIEIELSSEPFGITALPEVVDDQTSIRQIAVTMPKENKFIVMQVKRNKLQLSQEVPTNGACYGIGLLGNTYIVTFESPPRIEYITFTGERIACIENQSCGKQLFEKPRYIAVDKEREQIYISDTASHAITVLDKAGIIVGYFQEPGIITEPKGIVVDKKGTLLVCVWWPYSIQRISGDLLEVETLAFKPNVWGPEAIAYCASENRFYVAVERSDILEYQLSD